MLVLNAYLLSCLLRSTQCQDAIANSVIQVASYSFLDSGLT